MTETQWRYAGFWIRFLAYLVDGFVLTIVLGIIIVPLALMLGLSTAAMENGAYDDYGSDASPLAALSLFLIIAVALVGDLLYFALFECSRHQATPGKMVVGVRVVDERGERITFGRALGRTLGKVLSGMFCNAGYIIAAFTERKQALHDLLATTYVVEKQTTPPPNYYSGPPQQPPSQPTAG